jgi:hypothetical protein
MGCIESLRYEVILKNASFRECRDYIREHFSEYREFPIGEKIFDSYLIGQPPILIGIEGDALILPYTKPCHGTFLLKIPCQEEVDRIRALKK